jgi:threonine dehydratase
VSPPSGRFLDPDRILQARAFIDPELLDTPVVGSPAVDAAAGCSVALKLETASPIRCFKGRGACVLLGRELADVSAVVAASAGNFGLGLAYAARLRGIDATIFAAEDANPDKLAAIRALGARVEQVGRDFDDAKSHARNHAARRALRFVEDGAEAAIAEGAGTLGAELAAQAGTLDAVFVPLGNGALAGGVGAWLKAWRPTVRLIAVAAEGAPCMVRSLREGRLVETPEVRTIADGVAVRVPIPVALESLAGVVDDLVEVSDTEIVRAMRLLHDAGQTVEPSGAVGLAGLMASSPAWRSARVATVLTGANLTSAQRERWLHHAA